MIIHLIANTILKLDNFIEKNTLPQNVIDSWQKFQNISNPNWSDSQIVWSLLMPELWKKAMET